MKRNCCFKVPFRSVDHVIFDLDGTLIDTEKLILEVVTNICEENGKVFTDNLHHKAAGAVVEDISRMLTREIDLQLEVEEFVEQYNKGFQELCVGVEMMPGAEKMVRHLSENEIPIAVATSSTEDHMHLKTQSNQEIFELMHHIVCGGSDPEVQHGKPAPDIYLVCASRFEEPADPAKCLVFEDAPNGVEGSLAAGMQVVMVPHPTVPYEIWKKATLRLDSMEYMAPELFGLPPFEIQGTPVPKISFSLLSEEERRPVNVWEKIKADIRGPIESEAEGEKKEEGEGEGEVEEEAAEEGKEEEPPAE